MDQLLNNPHLSAKIEKLNFLAPLAFRIYLFIAFWLSGLAKFRYIQTTSVWISKTLWGLWLPVAHGVAYFLTGIEIMGAWCLLIGFAVRWVSIPLMVMILISMIFMNLGHGWFIIAPEYSESAQRLSEFLSWLERHYPSWYEYIHQYAQPVMLTNGVEMSFAYFFMLLSLFFSGAGRYASMDYWLERFH